MLGLILILIAELQFEGTSGGKAHLYHRAGDNVFLPCTSPSASYSCSVVNWSYSRESFTLEVVNGKVLQSSPRASRLNLDSNCSLIINNITADDAGSYTCLLRSLSAYTIDGDVYLSVLTISPSLPEEDVTLQCSLSRDPLLGTCPEKIIIWLDETGTELTGESVGYNLRQPKKCVSSLTLQHQRNTNRIYTCQLVVENNVKVEAHYDFRRQYLQIYHRAGDDAVLSCKQPPTFSSCSAVSWIFKRHKNKNIKYQVREGNIDQSLSRSARLSLDHKCSLIINNITAEDAGRYRCQLWTGGTRDTYVYLNILTISPSPPDVDPKMNGNVTLQCSLHKYYSLGSCPDNSLLWVDETGSELLGEGVGYKYERQTGCVSYLTVKLQSSRRFSCQFLEENTMKIESHYESDSKAISPDNRNFIIIIIHAAIGVLLLLFVLVAVFIKQRKTRLGENPKTTSGDQDLTHENHPNDELQSNMTYATVNHSKTSSVKIRQDEDTVTYSAVKTKDQS